MRNKTKLLIIVFLLNVVNIFSYEQNDIIYSKKIFFKIQSLYYNKKEDERWKILEKLRSDKGTLDKIESLTLFYWELMENNKNDYNIYKDKLIDNIELAINKKTKNPMIYYIDGYVLYNEKKYKSSAINYNRAIKLGILELWGKLYPNLSYILYSNFANSFAEANKIEEAEEYYKKLINVTQKDVVGYIFLSDFYFRRKKDVNEGLKYIQIALELSKNGYTKNEMIARIYNMMGKMYEKKGDKIKAIECYEDAINNDPNRKKYKTNLQNIKSKAKK